MACGYENLAIYYDRLMSGFDYDAYFKLVSSEIKSGAALDLGCGSGRFSRMLAEYGFRVTAVDLSSEMLNVAVTNTRKTLGITYLKADMTDLPFFKKFDLISATCDAVNYVSKEKLKGFFAQVFDMLNDNGVFVFDISSEYKLKNILGNNFFFEDLPELTYFWQNTLFDDYVKMQLYFFEPNGNLYKRTDEEHRQFIHSESDIKQALDGKFTSVTVFDGKTFTRDINERTERLLFVCRKKND